MGWHREAMIVKYFLLQELRTTCTAKVSQRSLFAPVGLRRGRVTNVLTTSHKPLFGAPIGPRSGHWNLGRRSEMLDLGCSSDPAPRNIGELWSLVLGPAVGRRRRNERIKHYIRAKPQFY